MYKLYDSVNGEWFSEQEYSRKAAKAYLLREQDNQSLRDGDVYFAKADSNGDYDGDVIELRDLVKDLA
jgi:hypothetical protein